MTPHLWQKVKKKKSLLKKVKEESEKVDLKLNIQKTKIMASGPIASWQIDSETMETVRDFTSGGSKITTDGDWSQEIKRHLLLGRKAVRNLHSILKSRDITLPTKVCLVKATVFPVMYGCESWTIKKGEHQKIDAFELWCWRRLLRVPWTARRSNQWIPKVISPEYSLLEWCWSWNSKTLATSCEELTHWKWPWYWERLKVGEEDDRRWDGWMASLAQWTWAWASSKSSWWTGKSHVLQSIGSQRIGHDSANWSELIYTYIQVRFTAGIKGWLNIWKSISLTSYHTHSQCKRK